MKIPELEVLNRLIIALEVLQNSSGMIFRAIRIDLDISQETLAKHLKVSRGVITKIENRKIVPSLKQLKQVKEFYVTRKN